MPQLQMRKKLYISSQTISEPLRLGHKELGLNKMPEISPSPARPGTRNKNSSDARYWVLADFFFFFPIMLNLHREKLYEEKLLQQKQELKQLHEERQRLIEIQGQIQDLQWACPDLQVLHTGHRVERDRSVN